MFRSKPKTKLEFFRFYYGTMIVGAGSPKTFETQNTTQKGTLKRCIIEKKL
jgi:hypothetical protein